MGAGASKPAPEEAKRAYKKCAWLASAHAQCVKAAGGGAGGAAACERLETSLLGCLAAQAAPAEAEAHTKCVNRAMSTRGRGVKACAGEVEAMRKAVRSKGLWPPPPP
jgi:hypothetical protein